MSPESPIFINHPLSKVNDGYSVRVESSQPWAQIIAHKNLDRMQRNSPEELHHEKPYWLLEGTGFDVRSQVDKLLRDQAAGALQGEERGKIVKGWVNQTIQDIIGYDLEYLKGELVFPILLGIREVEGKKRVVGREYNNQPWLDTVLPQERNGAVKESIGRMEQFLLHGSEGDAAIMVSPPEWSGLKTREGKDIIFPDTQIYIVQKLGGDQINAMTLRLDLTADQCEKVLNKMGVEVPEGVDRNGKIQEIVKSIVFKRSSEGRFSTDELINTLEEVKGSTIAHKGKTFDQMRGDKGRIEELLKMDEKTKEIIGVFKDFSEENSENLSEENRETLERILGETLLKLTIFEKKISIPTLNLGIVPALPKGLVPMDMLVALKTMQSIGGCAGGGATSTASGGAFRVGIVPGSKEAFFECPGCHKGIPSGEGRTSCPHCFLSKYSYQQSSGVACD